MYSWTLFYIHIAVGRGSVPYSFPRGARRSTCPHCVAVSKMESSSWNCTESQKTSPKLSLAEFSTWRKLSDSKLHSPWSVQTYLGLQLRHRFQNMNSSLVGLGFVPAFSWPLGHFHGLVQHHDGLRMGVVYDRLALTSRNILVGSKGFLYWIVKVNPQHIG